jgi:hypothetical protein
VEARIAVYQEAAGRLTGLAATLAAQEADQIRAGRDWIERGLAA